MWGQGDTIAECFGAVTSHVSVFLKHGVDTKAITGSYAWNCAASYGERGHEVDLAVRSRVGEFDEASLTLCFYVKVRTHPTHVRP